jgi:hypothetical protein
VDGLGARRVGVVWIFEFATGGELKLAGALLAVRGGARGFCL